MLLVAISGSPEKTTPPEAPLPPIAPASPRCSTSRSTSSMDRFSAKARSNSARWPSPQNGHDGRGFHARSLRGPWKTFGQTNKRGYGGSGEMGAIPLAPFPIPNLVKAQFGGNIPVSLVPPVSLRVGFPETWGDDSKTIRSWLVIT